MIRLPSPGFRLPVAVGGTLLAALVLAGCGGKAASGAAAAKVNGEVISQGQIDFALAQQRGLKPEQGEAASRQVLDRMIELELAAQKAAELKLENHQGVQMALEMARREILAKAFSERVGESVPKPTAEDIEKVYQERPLLFRDRRIYNLQELGIEARPEQHDELRQRLASAQNIGEFVEQLRRGGFRFSANQVVRTPEQLPAATLEQAARLRAGQAFTVAVPNGLNVVLLAAVSPQPATLDQARPAIEQLLLQERRQKALADEMKTLRAAAKIEFEGKFAGKAASSP